jgi:hypothetical protein
MAAMPGAVVESVDSGSDQEERTADLLLIIERVFRIDECDQSLQKG